MKNYLTYIGTISFITLASAVLLDVFVASAIFILASAYGLILEVE
ncbi:MAG: hypothetical protein NRZ54_10260 [Staphylococcus haemolyticus]|nr:hypothetical protein NRZ53_07660 [Staphylococcus haemolyticus]WAI21304.1 MAG: hypothetical protein NRZ55_04580 [Staphylococcus haemolyticus]WAI22471.1 MAG: hypothetical protein NRZ54_10260 [Staphylococcus haemolyticus]